MLKTSSPNKGTPEVVISSDAQNVQNYGDNSPRKINILNMGYKASPEENTGRKAKTHEFFKGFQTQLQKLKEIESPLTFRDKIRENSDSLYAYLDNVFSLFNLNINIIQQDQSDSALRIEPVLQLGKAVPLLAYVAVVLSKFPYSFIKNIDLNKFTVCRKVQLKKDEYESLFTTRVMVNGIFMTEIHDTYEKVEKHFYKIVLHHIIKKVPAIHTDWPLDLSPKLEGRSLAKKLSGYPTSPEKNNSPVISSRGITNSPKLIKSDEKKPKFSIDEVKTKEEHEIFYRLMMNPKETLERANSKLLTRVLYLKDQLENIDEVGISKDWWDGLVKTNYTIVEGDFGDFALKI